MSLRDDTMTSLCELDGMTSQLTAAAHVCLSAGHKQSSQRQTHGTQTASEQLLPQEKPRFNHSIAQRFLQCHYEQVGDFWSP